jgi:dihydrofolate reductase
MPRVTCDVTVSLDGYVAGPRPTLADPMGEGGVLHRWMSEHAEENAAEIAGITAAGAYVMGRNMFGPGRGPWDPSWRGRWGDEPPYHAPVFVLTHHAHEPIEMQGGTTFHFVTEGFDAAFEQARAAAGDKGVDIAGGASTVRQALKAGVIDELVVDISPVLLGSGERIFDDVGDLDLEQVEAFHSPLATHIRYRVRR